MLAACGAWQLYRHGARDRLTLATAGWALSCTLFLIIGIITPVDMRYYLAAVPAVAIAAAGGVGGTLASRARSASWRAHCLPWSAGVEW